MPTFNDLKNKECVHILGLMSGTSCDGLDIALVNVCGSELKTRFTVEATKSFAYPDHHKKQLLTFISKKEHTLKEVSQFNFFMAKIWAGQIEQFRKENNLRTHSIDVIASHGQTIWHQPDPEEFLSEDISSTLQLGDPSVLAALLNIPVVGDFRVADVALGGQGAPLIPYFDWVFFSQFRKNILALNIGGISNITYIPANGNFREVIAFDCGPGNMLIDAATQNLFGKPFDENGNIGASGEKDERLFQFIQEKDTFSDIKPPKSTGRELYNQKFVHDILRFANKNDTPKKDIINTLTQYTAYAIFNSHNNFIKTKIDELAIGGGGSKNRFLVKILNEYFENVKVNSTSFYNLNEDFKEAIGFAILANETIRGNTSNVPSATGAKRTAILGKICLV